MKKELEKLYEFIGQHEAQLLREYKRIKKPFFSFAQFCVVMYSNLTEEN